MHGERKRWTHPILSFVVRMWLEPSNEESRGEWRGELRSVPDGRRYHFRTLDGLARLVEQLARRVQDR